MARDWKYGNVLGSPLKAHLAKDLRSSGEDRIGASMLVGLAADVNPA